MTDDAQLTEQMAELRAGISRLEGLVQAQMQESRLLRVDAVMERTGLGRTSVYKLVSEGRFPRPVHPEGLNVALWPAHAVEAWIHRQAEGCHQEVV